MRKKRVRVSREAIVEEMDVKPSSSADLVAVDLNVILNFYFLLLYIHTYILYITIIIN